SECPWVSDAGDQSSGKSWSDTGNHVEPPACLTGSVPGSDHTIELQDLSFQHSQLGAEGCNTDTGYLGQPLVSQVGDDTEQLVYTIASDWRDDAKLRKMCTDRIDHRSLLTDE